MEHFDIIILLMLAIICEGNAELKIHVPKNFSAGEVINGSCVAIKEDFANVPQALITITSDSNGCTLNESNELKTEGRHHKKNFTITCTTSGSHHIECSTNGMYHIHKRINFQVTEKPIPSPKITNKPSNITIAVGLPITFSCYVEGDPNSYWVGWMTKNTIIQPGEEYAVSTSPSFKSVNGTTHYLTVHTVKGTSKYDCKVYDLAGDVVDFITHKVIISHDATRVSSKSSPSIETTH